jgi:hypothetical protein
MLRTLNNRRRHRFVPSLGGATSTLEDRALLSALAGSAVHHLVDQPAPPNGSVGPIVANSAAVHAAAPGQAPPNGSVGPIVA